MMRKIIVVMLCLLWFLPVMAQDVDTYAIALERIEEARASGATRLDLIGLGLNELPPEIWQLTNLVHLYLQNNQLSSLPPEIGQLTNLTSVSLAGNNLQTLPPELGNLTHLEWMSLWDNQLTSLPPEIGTLSNLRILWLGGNQLRDLPTEIGQLMNLEKLDVSENHLRELPIELGYLRNLCLLELSENELRFLPRELGELERLTNRAECSCEGECHYGIFLDGNPLISPPPEVVSQGTGAILEYLQNQPAYYLNRYMLWGGGIIGLAAASIIGVRWRNRHGKSKKKNDISYSQ